MRKKLLLLTFLTASAAFCSAESRPNILFLFADDHALQAISAYGGRFKDVAPTPNIDRIAKQGAVFERSYCTNSICGPSRACVLTGKHSHINGFIDNENHTFDGSQPTFPKYLQSAGYQTSIIGKWHLVSKPTGFDHWEILPDQGSYYNPDFIQMDGKTKRFPGYCTDITGDKAIDWLTRQRDPSKPFVLMCQFKAPHRTWAPAERHYPLFKDADLPEPPTLFDDYANRSETLQQQEMTLARHFLWGHDLKLPGKSIHPAIPNGVDGEFMRMSPVQKDAFMRAYSGENQKFIADLQEGKLDDKAITRWKYQRYIKDYLRCIRAVDENVGRILDCLEKSGLASNTIVIYSADQGFYLGEHGWYDKRWMFEESLAMPFIIRWPGVIPEGVRSKAMIQNIDYAPTFLDAAGVKIPEDIQGRSLVPVFKNGCNPTPGWRDAVYYSYSGEKTHHVPAHDGVRNERYKLFHLPKTNQWQLFDLEKDPMEMKSIHDDPKASSVLAEMKSIYQKLRRQYRVE